MQSLVPLTMAGAAVAVLVVGLVWYFTAHSGDSAGKQPKSTAKAKNKSSHKKKRPSRGRGAALSPMSRRMAGSTRLEVRKPWGW